MAVVNCPFFSTWASGSVGKVLTVRWRGKGKKFVMAKYKSKSGKRTDIQIENARIFKDRVKLYKEFLRETIEE